jgi:NADH dehydrogenase (ubiquinone) 1 alpha subcomplex subunit 5
MSVSCVERGYGRRQLAGAAAPLALFLHPLLHSKMRSFRALRQAVHAAAPTHIPRQRLTTNLTGLAVHPEPLPTLLHTYTSTLSLLSQFPPSAVYRQSVESITKERIAAIEQLGGKGSEQEIEAVEEKIGAGYIEEVLLMAEDELTLTAKMLEWKA